MTNAGDMHSEDDDGGKAEIGTALAPTTIGGGIDPFIAGPSADRSPPRGLGATLLDYSAHAAIIVGLIGFAWTVSSHLAARPTAAQIEAPSQAASATPPVSQKVDEMAQLRAANAELASDIKTLHANLDTLRNNVRQDRTSSEVHALEADLKTVKSGLNSTKSETDAALAQLSGKVDKLRASHQGIDTTATGSIGPAATTEASLEKSIPTPPIKPASAKLASADDAAAKPILSGWVVRDVYDGVALIQGKRGPMEVVPGVSIPGAGVVKSIDRHGNGWTVTTSKGLLAYAAPPHDYRRVNSRDFYPPYPTDY